MNDRATVEPSDAILTAPNLITLCRLALIGPFVWLALTERNDAVAWTVGFVLGSTDWVDGMVARKFRQVSKLGIAMDPLIDRLAILSIAAVVVVRELVPVWAIGIVVLREALLLAAVPVLAAWKVPRPAVTRVGKLGFFTLMWGFALFFLVTVPEPPATWLRPVAWALYAIGVVLAYTAALGYLRSAVAARRDAVA